MFRVRRRFVHILLVIFVANTLLWVMDAEAFTGLEQYQDVVIAQMDFDHGSNPSVPDQHQYCTHGCHSANHFQGCVSQDVLISIPDLGVLSFPSLSVQRFSNDPNGLFRPPRVFSPA